MLVQQSMMLVGDLQATSQLWECYYWTVFTAVPSKKTLSELASHDDDDMVNRILILN